MRILYEQALMYPKKWFLVTGSICVALLIMVITPTLRPDAVPFLNPLHVDTDPENMLDADEPVRVFHNLMKEKFNLHDIIVVGVINKSHKNGVFNPKSLRDISDLTAFAKTIQWEEGGKTRGVIGADVIAPSTVDNIEQGGLGSITFEWLMPEPPQTDEAALAIAEKAKRIPFLKDTLISSEGKALALYIPITSKGVSFDVAEKLRTKIATFDTTDEYYITGLPVAQDQFGSEMFKQMARSAPMAMMLIFLLMWFFFRHVKLIIAPLIVALMSVIMTMGLLVVTGNTIHIMSSMIPIFIMPISVLDAVHILSDFFDRYPKIKDRRKTLKEVMSELSSPMFFTSLTTCAGFASLVFTPIPPVQVFGSFIAFGVFIAWVLTISLVPAYIMLMPESSLSGFGMLQSDNGSSTWINRFLSSLGQFTYNRAKLILMAIPVLGVLAYYGISKIEINDNPVRWFEKQHPIRVADAVLNERFAGTYMAYLTLRPSEEVRISFNEEDLLLLPQRIRSPLSNKLKSIESSKDSVKDLMAFVLDQQEAAESDAAWDAWDKALLFLEDKKQEADVFKDPNVLRYIERLQKHLLDTGLVGKSNALPDIVKTVHRELFLGEEQAFRIPESAAAVAQTLITYEGSHRPQDLWHFVTPDYRNTNLWIQLKSGDNKDMQALVRSVDEFFAKNPGPINLTHDWFGLTYINVIWQEKMVAGMRSAFIGSFIIVLGMMIFLFRSFWWGLFSMIPLAGAIGLIYGAIGFIGKDYDMPVAVLSSLSLGLAVDYAIHFLARSRFLRSKHEDWKGSVADVFSEPSRAIVRNVVVIGVGFLPLLAAPLIPYKTVGFFISSILLTAGGASLVLLPALITVFERFLFKKKLGENV